MLLVLAGGLLVYKDYGISWDEPAQIAQNGYVVYEYVFLDSTHAYINSSEKYHGAIIELGLFTLAKIADVNDSRSMYLLRHLVCFIFFWLSGFFLIGILNLLFNNKIVTLTGLAMYFLAPRIFPDAFYNSKDIPFLAVTTMTIYTFLRLFEKPDLKNALLHAVFCGLLVGIRITGVIVPLLSIGVILITAFLKPGKLKIIAYTLLFIVFTSFSIVAFWPILWEGPFMHFLAAWNEMKQFSWHNTVLFKGEFVYSDALPWYYIPFWIFVTTPPFYLFLFLVSLATLIIDFVKSEDRLAFTTRWVFFVLLFFMPIIAIIYLKSVLYDGWRHVYFLYSPFVIMSCYAVYFIAKSRFIYKKFAAVIMGLCFLLVFRNMSELHPYEHVYFNNLYYKGIKDARFEMEMDYWGLTYQEALRYILDHDDRSKIRVKVDNAPGLYNLLLLKEYQKERLEVDVDNNKDYDYFIGNYRWRQSEYDETGEIYAIIRDSARICTIFKSMNKVQ